MLAIGANQKGLRDKGGKISQRIAEIVHWVTPMASEERTIDRRPGMDVDFLALKKKIVAFTSIDCEKYKDSYLKRRISVRMRSTGCSNYSEYSHYLSSTPDEIQKLLEDMTINVTHFFRDKEVFNTIEEDILPVLIYEKVIKESRMIRVWSAGCSSGEEAYSIAIILKELLDEEFDCFIVSILGTDIDEDSLETARIGSYMPRQVTEIPDEYLDKYFTFDGERYQISEEILRMAKFRNLDLISGNPGRRFDLILCRNVTIYFTREMQERLYMDFYNALNNGGYFIMGNTETLVGEASSLLTPISSRKRIYRKQS